MHDVIFYATSAGREPLREWLQSLPREHRREVGAVIWVLQKMGPALGMPHAKAIGRGLHELRIPLQGMAYRVFYGFVGQRLILLTHGIIKKSEKTPRHDLDLARHRLIEYLRQIKETA